MQKILLALVATSLILIFIVKFILGNTPEQWEYGQELGDVVFNLSIGYLTSYFFYILVVWIPEYKTKKKMRTVLSEPLDTVLAIIHSSISFVASDAIFRKKIDEATFNNKLEDVKVNDDIREIISGVLEDLDTYLDYFYADQQRLFKQINEIMVISNVLESDLIIILNEVKSNEWHYIVDFSYKLRAFQGTSPNYSIKRSSSTLYKYYLTYFEIADYMNKNKIKSRYYNVKNYKK